MATRGPRAIYRPKDPPPESALLTPLGKRILRAATDRCGTNKSNVIETLLRLHGGELTADLFRPFEV